MGKVNFDNVVNRYGTYSTQWDYVKDRFGEENLLPFTISDMDFKAPDNVSTKIAEIAQKGLFGYTRWNNPEFKGAIRNWYDKRYGVKVDQNWVVYSPTVIFSLAKLLEQFSQPNDKVVTFGPCYDAFINTIAANRRKLIQLNVNNGLNIELLETTFKKEHPEVFLLCNPHNPLGITWSDQQMMEMVQLCNSYNVAIISDEIHADILRKWSKFNSLTRYFNELTVHAAVLSSASKTFNIPTLGCSYAIIPEDLDRLQFLNALKQKNALSSVPYLGMMATIECYNNSEYWLDQLNDYLDTSFDYTKEFLNQEIGLKYEIPQATYLAWIDISPLNISMRELQENLVKKQKVAIMDGKVYGNGGTNHLRLNLGAPRSKVIDGLQRLKVAIQELKKES